MKYIFSDLEGSGLMCQFEGNQLQQSFVSVYQLAAGSNRAQQHFQHAAESLTNGITKGCFLEKYTHSSHTTNSTQDQAKKHLSEKAREQFWDLIGIVSIVWESMNQWQFLWWNIYNADGILH